MPWAIRLLIVGEDYGNRLFFERKDRERLNQT